MSALPQLPERPPSEVEWEELLVRLEITPRAVRSVVDDAAGRETALHPVMERLVGLELWLARTLDELRQGEPVSTDVPLGRLTTESGDEVPAARLAAAFAELRARNFARVQRRGLEVWDWRSPVAGGEGSLTAYQVLSMITQADGHALAQLRAAAGGGLN